MHQLIGTRRYRALFLSDVHLGTKGCQADKLLDFLRFHDADVIYLVGDMVDGWQLRSSWYWPQSHNDVVQKLLRKARKGARIIYVPGNHDEFLRGYYGTHFGGVEVAETAIHHGADGRRYLVIHGDHFDMVVKHARWLALLGDYAYTTALIHQPGLQCRPPPARPSLLVAVAMAQAQGQERGQLYRRIRAHPHCGSEPPRGGRRDLRAHPSRRIRDDLGVRYVNCGDWVESCTAIAEHTDGRFEIITWASVSQTTPHLDAPAVAAERQAA